MRNQQLIRADELTQSPYNVVINTPTQHIYISNMQSTRSYQLNSLDESTSDEKYCKPMQIM